jgi:hypothetical protein
MRNYLIVVSFEYLLAHHVVLLAHEVSLMLGNELKVVVFFVSEGGIEGRSWRGQVGGTEVDKG